MGAGLRAVAGGISFILGTPSVWPYAAVPVALLLLLSCGLGILGLWGANWLTDWLLGVPEGAWGQAGRWGLIILFALLGLLLAVLIALLLAQPLSGFALEAIVRAQERALTGRTPPDLSFFAALLVSLQITLLTAIIGGSAFALLWLIGFLFPPALALTVPLNFLLGGWLLAWNFLDYPLTLHGLGVWARVRWCARHFAAFSAFGLAWAVLLLVPGLFFVVLPMGVAGATRLVLDPAPTPHDLI